MSTWLDRAMTFEPSAEMRRRLTENRETFAQYVVRVMSYRCTTCDALPGIPCNETIASSVACGGQFHRARAVAAQCPVTKHYLKDDL